MKITNKQIREYIGHNGDECKVRIKNDGTIYKYGSPVTTDRSEDFWMFIGNVDEIKAEIVYSHSHQRGQ